MTNIVTVDEGNYLSLFEQILKNNVTVLEFGNRRELVAIDLSKRAIPKVHTYRRFVGGDIGEYVYRIGIGGSLSEPQLHEKYLSGTEANSKIDCWMEEAKI